MPSCNLPTTEVDGPKAKIQSNHRCAGGCAYTDTDSDNLKESGGWIQGYNCQAAVDGDHQNIVAVEISNQAADQHHLLPMLERIVANTGKQPETPIADACYCCTANIEASEKRGLDACYSSSWQQHGQWPRPSWGPACRDLGARGWYYHKLSSKAGQAIYALRKIIVEPVFRQIKRPRCLDCFLLRGQEKVSGEWALMATSHNIGKMH